MPGLMCGIVRENVVSGAQCAQVHSDVGRFDKVCFARKQEIRYDNSRCDDCFPFNRLLSRTLAGSRLLGDVFFICHNARLVAWPLHFPVLHIASKRLPLELAKDISTESFFSFAKRQNHRSGCRLCFADFCSAGCDDRVERVDRASELMNFFSGFFQGFAKGSVVSDGKNDSKPSGDASQERQSIESQFPIFLILIYSVKAGKHKKQADTEQCCRKPVFFDPGAAALNAVKKALKTLFYLIKIHFFLRGLVKEISLACHFSPAFGGDIFNVNHFLYMTYHAYHHRGEQYLLCGCLSNCRGCNSLSHSLRQAADQKGLVCGVNRFICLLRSFFNTLQGVWPRRLTQKLFPVEIC